MSTSLPIALEEEPPVQFPKFKCLLLVLFGFFVLFKPQEPFLVLFFVEEKGLTQSQVYEDIFPIWTYSYFACLLLLGILSEFIGYRATIFVGILGNIATILILLFSSSLFLLQLQEVTVGIGSGAFIIFGSFLYRTLPSRFYQSVTSAVKAAYLFGAVTSALLGQLLVKEGVSLFVLFQISLGAMSVAGCSILLFPKQTKELSPTPSASILSLVRDVVQTYKSEGVLLWALWGGVALAIHHLVLTYWQSLFLEYSKEDSANYNGLVSAVAYLTATGCALVPAKLERFIPTLAPFFLSLFPLLNGFCLVVLAWNESLGLNYFIFVLYHCSFEFMNPIVSVQIAKKMPTVRFGLIFAINTTVAMLFQTLIQLLVGKKVLHFHIRQQFLFFGGCLLVLGLFYSIYLTCSSILKRLSSPSHSYRPLNS